MSHVYNPVGAATIDAIDEPLESLRRRIAWNPGELKGWTDVHASSPDAGDGALPPEPAAKDDPILLVFTSCTVSDPKIGPHPASDGAGHMSSARFWHDLRPGDRRWTVSDTGWTKAAWGCLVGQFHERATVVQVALGKSDADGILSIISGAQITSSWAPPTPCRMLVQSDFFRHDLSTLRYCPSAGEPRNPELIRERKERVGGATVYHGYGQPETTVLVAIYRSMPIRPRSMGKPVPGWDVEVLDESGQPAANDEVGNIATRVSDPWPMGLLQEYYRDADANAHSFRGGWYYTGNKAWRIGDGYLWFDLRDDDVITSSAYQDRFVRGRISPRPSSRGRDGDRRQRRSRAHAGRHTFLPTDRRLRGERPARARAPRPLAHAHRTVQVAAQDPLRHRTPKGSTGKIRRFERREQHRAGLVAGLWPHQ